MLWPHTEKPKEQVKDDEGIHSQSIILVLQPNRTILFPDLVSEKESNC